MGIKFLAVNLENRGDYGKLAYLKLQDFFGSLFIDSFFRHARHTAPIPASFTCLSVDFCKDLEEPCTVPSQPHCKDLSTAIANR